MMLPAWRYYKDLVIDHTKIDEDLTDFPVVVKLDSSNFDFSRAQSTGSDIRFVLPDRTILKYEREQHDSTNQKAVYHVKIPTASSSTDTPFRVYFGNPSAIDGADPTNVWDSGFKMVQHMNDNPDTSHIKDSTVNGNDGTKYAAGQPTETDGVIGKAQSFDGVDDYVDLGTTSIEDGIGNWSITALIKIPETSSAENEFDIYVRRTADSDNGAFVFHIGTWDGSDSYIVVSTNDGSWHDSVSNSQISINTPTLVSATCDGTNVTFYKNGVNDGSVSYTPPPSVDSLPQSLGRAGGVSALYFNGLIDENRISNVTRSPAYVKANDYNLRLNTLLTFGTTRANVNSLFFANNF